MKPSRRWLIVLVALGGPRMAMGQNAGYEAHIDSVLRASDVLAESLFVAANGALARKDYEQAMELFRRVRQRVPDFAPATRRLAYIHSELGNHRLAVALLDSLLDRDSTAFTRSALATALVREPEGTKPTPAEVERAGWLIRLAIREAPDDPNVWGRAVEVAFAGAPPDTSLLRRAAQALVRLEPGEWQAWATVTQYGLMVDDPAIAAAALERAHALGMPPEVEQTFAGFLEASQQARQRTNAVWMGLEVLAAWILAFLLLFAIGVGLSHAALRAAGRALSDPTGGATGLDASLRSLYRAVLWGSSAFFYVSMPLLLVVVLATGGGLVYLLLRIGNVPVKLLLIIVVVTGVTAFAIVRGLFARHEDQDPGARADLGTQPRLRHVLDDVAQRIGTRPVDTVFLTPGTEVAVFERGDMRHQLQGRTERCLILGIGVLEGMTVRQLKSIFAHEYGHFSNRDTAGGGLALSVRRSLVSIARGIAEGGAAAWYNPAWLFLRAFHSVFMRISQGASRLQEVLADRWAASAYGSLAFEQGLTHVIETSVRFASGASRVIAEALEHHRPLVNLYQSHAASKPEADEQEAQDVKEAFDAEPSPYDSHPGPRQRLEWVRRYGSSGEAAEADDDLPAWSLLEGREALEESMTAHVRADLEARHGVEFVSS
jgi:Zn-dependent protease with chaperone function